MHSQSNIEQQFLSLLPDDQSYLVRRIDGAWLNILFQPASQKNVTYIEGEGLVLDGGTYTYSFKALASELSEMPEDYQKEFAHVIAKPLVEAMASDRRLPGYFVPICDGEKLSERISFVESV